MINMNLTKKFEDFVLAVEMIGRGIYDSYSLSFSIIDYH